MSKRTKRKSTKSETETKKEGKTEVIQELNENVQSDPSPYELIRRTLPPLSPYWLKVLSVLEFGSPQLKVLTIAPLGLYLLFGKIAVIAWACLMIVCTPVALVLKVLKPTIERFIANGEEEKIEPEIVSKEEGTKEITQNETEKRMQDLNKKIDALIQMNHKLTMGEKLPQKIEKPKGLIGTIANVIYNIIFFSISIVFLVSLMLGNIPMIPAVILYVIILIVMKLMHYTGMVKVFIYAILAVICTVLIGLLVMGIQLIILKLLQMGFITK